MSYIPTSLANERSVWMRETKLQPVSLGILHYSPQGGGYHEGIDLLKQAGRYLGQSNPDYSVRQSARDQPGTDAGSAIDIGYFDVNVQRADGSWRRVTLRDYNAWMVAQLDAGAPDVAFVRELIYSLDGKTVKRWDRLGRSTTGDSSHLSHSHRSDFRDDEHANKAAHVERFWSEMRGQGVSYFSDYNAKVEAFRIKALFNFEDRSDVDGPRAGEQNQMVAQIKGLHSKLDLLLAEAAADKARDSALATAFAHLADQIKSGGGSLDVAAVVNAVNMAAAQTKTAVLDELADQRKAAAEAARAAAQAYEEGKV